MPKMLRTFGLSTLTNWLPRSDCPGAIATQGSRKGDDSSSPQQELLSMTLDQYLKLLDWTGRQIRKDQTGRIPVECAAILERLKCNTETWLDFVKNFRKHFRNEAGLLQNRQHFRFTSRQARSAQWRELREFQRRAGYVSARIFLQSLQIRGSTSPARFKSTPLYGRPAECRKQGASAPVELEVVASTWIVDFRWMAHIILPGSECEPGSTRSKRQSNIEYHISSRQHSERDLIEAAGEHLGALVFEQIQRNCRLNHRQQNHPDAETVDAVSQGHDARIWNQ